MKKSIDLFVTFLKWLGAAAMAGMMFLTCADVIMRAAGKPILGAVEITGFLATITLACSLPYTHIARGHVGVDMLVRRLPKRVQGFVDTLTGLLSFGLFGIIAWRSFKYAGTLKNTGEVSMTLEFPTYYFVYLIGIAFIILCLVLIPDIMNSGRSAVRK